MMRRVLPILLMALLAASPAFPFAKYGGEFLATGIGARPLGMGGAFVSIADDASAGYWNPAGIIFVQSREMIFMHSERFGDLINYDAGSFVQQLGDSNRNRSAFGFSFTRLGIDDIPYTRMNETSGRVEVDRYVTDAEWGLFLSYGRLWTNSIAVGGSVKMVRKSVGDDSAMGLGFDLGALIRPWRRLSVGVNLQDATTTFLVWDDVTETILPTLKCGLSYPFDIPALKGKLTVAADLDARFEGRKSATAYWIGSASADLRLGVEYWYAERLALRFGQERSEQNDWAAGAGFRIPVGGNTLGLDYAFLENSYLDDIHRVSGSFSF
ncbi:MAG: PorV/PorQ family protein [Candidatus Eisenbacteria bacterium]|nr:PorV/PorQ family protein [Candidatus Eisenbacteria bacterium]